LDQRTFRTEIASKKMVRFSQTDDAISEWRYKNMTFSKLTLVGALVLMLLVSTFASAQGGEWYGYANGTSRQDRERELSAQHPFTRITVPFNGIYPVALGDLCRYLNKTCTEVRDWEGNQKPCDEFSQFSGGFPIRDGSRIVRCN
jgi:hypothetical protein